MTASSGSGAAAPTRPLRLVDAVAQSLGAIGPVFGAAFIVPQLAGANVAAKGAGAAVPLAILIAAVGQLGLGWIISRFAVRVRSAGSLYDYTTLAFGRRAGFVAGWVYYLGIGAIALSIFLIFGGITSGLVQQETGAAIPYWAIDLGLVLVVAAATLSGMRLSTRAQLVLAGTAMLTIFAFAISVIAHGHSSGDASSAFNPSSAIGGGGLLFGIVYAVLLVGGFETAANLAERTDQPTRAIPRAVLISLGIAIVYFLVVSYAQVSGLNFAPKTIVGSASPLFSLAGSSAYGSNTFGVIVQVLVILDLIAIALGITLSASWGIFTLSRRRGVVTDADDADYASGKPMKSVLFMAAAGIVAILLVHFSGGLLSHPAAEPEYDPMFSWLSGFGGLCIAVLYIIVSVAGVYRLWNLERRLAIIVAGLPGAALGIAGVFGGIYKVPSPSNKAPWVLLACIVVGIALAWRIGGDAVLADDATPAMNE